MLAGQLQCSEEFIRLFINIFCDKTVRNGNSAIKYRFRQGIQERIGTAPNDKADYFTDLFQPSGICISNKMAVFNDFFHQFACGRIHIRPIIQYTADSSDRNTCQAGNILNCVYFRIQRGASFRKGYRKR